MAPSFAYPPNLLHKPTEPQWFPRPTEQVESSLDALEAAEQAHTDFLRSIAQKEAPDPIGLMATATASAGAHHPLPPPPNGMADPVAATAAVAGQPHQQPRFWNQRHAAGEAAAAAVEGESGSP